MQDDSDFEKKILEAFRNIIPNIILPIIVGFMTVVLFVLLCFRNHYIDLARFPAVVVREFPSVRTRTTIQENLVPV